ncbi:OmpA family protein [Porticoccus sp. W117]|uniref:OmpA family protein n=1 Tax=Porticoccus sp. W117 TaxID=3054777 RepID=UPI002598ACA6|nr:OmpA family protein [Porticoccus sp. W117]MDM3871030.1 OmpA family protein [Porticoccus sp. W117]
MRKQIAMSVAAVAFAAAASTTAQAETEHLYLGPTLGYYHADSKRAFNSDSNGSPFAQLTGGIRFHNNWALELGYGNNIGGSDLEKTELNAIFYLGDEVEYKNKLRTYIATGISRFSSDEANLINGFDSTWQGRLGFGLSKLYQNNWEVRGDVSVYHQIRDEGPLDNATDTAFNLSFLKHFGEIDAPAPVVAPTPVVEPEPVVEPAPQPEPEAEPETRTITVRLNVEFEFNSDVVRGIYGDELEAIANAMKVQEDIELVLEGHTDSRGADDYNQDLSERRAKAVKATLADTYGISADRISAVGYGESRPVASNDTDEGRQRNRRVVGEMSYTEVAPQ